VFTPQRIAAMTRGKPTASTCADLSEWVQRLHGKSQAPTAAMDKRVVDCLLAKLWPHNGRDHLVTEALNRENSRLALVIKQAGGAHKTGVVQDIKPPLQTAASGRPAGAPSPPRDLDDISTLVRPTGNPPPGSKRLAPAPENPTPAPQ